MTTNIRTRWHKVAPLVKAGAVALTAPPKGEGQWYEDCGGKLDVLLQFLKDAEKLPHFVIEPELLELAGKDDYQRSLFDMKRGGVLRLPYPAMVVEWTDTKNSSGSLYTQFVIIRDLYDKKTFFPWEDMGASAIDVDEKTITEIAKNSGLDIGLATNDHDGMDFYGFRLSLEKDSEGEYVSLSPSVITGSIEQRDGDPWLKFGGYAHGLLPANSRVNDIVQNTYMKDIGSVFYAVSSAYLLMKTEGVDAETVDTTRINKKRTGTVDQPFVPKHTYIKIGRVYRSKGSEQTDEYEPRKSPRPHWRRGHLRHVRYGVGRVNIREIYIYPRLVAYKPDSVVPPTPDYKVVK